MLSVAADNQQAQEADSTAVPVAALAAFDQRAWQELFDAYFDRMYRFAYLRTGDHHLAEEVASEVFAAAAKGIRRYRETGAPFAAWLYRIARNITADHVDRRRRQGSQLPLDGLELASQDWDGAVEVSVDLAAAMSKLTREQQEVLILRFFNGCSLLETATALDKSLGAAKVLQARALAALRRRLAPGGRR